MDALIARLQRQFRDYTISLYRQFVSWTEYISRRWKQIIRRKHDLEDGAA